MDVPLRPIHKMTRAWHSKDVLRSLLQKLIRRGETERAQKVAIELAVSGEPFGVLKTLIVVMFEDIGYPNWHMFVILLQEINLMCKRTSKMKKHEPCQDKEFVSLILNVVAQLSGATLKSRIGASLAMACLDRVPHPAGEWNKNSISQTLGACLRSESKSPEDLLIREKDAAMCTRWLIYNHESARAMEIYAKFQSPFVRTCLEFLGHNKKLKDDWYLIYMSMILYICREPAALESVQPAPTDLSWLNLFLTPGEFQTKHQVLAVRAHITLDPICLDKHTPWGKAAWKGQGTNSAITLLSQALSRYPSVTAWLTPEELEKSHPTTKYAKSQGSVDFFLRHGAVVIPEASAELVWNPYKNIAYAMYVALEIQGTKAKAASQTEVIFGPQPEKKVAKRKSSSSESQPKLGFKRVKRPVLLLDLEEEEDEQKVCLVTLKPRPVVLLDEEEEEEGPKKVVPKRKRKADLTEVAARCKKFVQDLRTSRKKEIAYLRNIVAHPILNLTLFRNDIDGEVVSVARIIETGVLGQRRTAAQKRYVKMCAEYPGYVIKGPFDAMHLAEYALPDGYFARARVFERMMRVESDLDGRVVLPLGVVGESTNMMMSVHDLNPDTAAGFVSSQGLAWVVTKQLSRVDPSSWTSKLLDNIKDCKTDQQVAQCPTMSREVLQLMAVQKFLNMNEQNCLVWTKTHVLALFRILMYACAMGVGDVSLLNVILSTDPSRPADWFFLDYEEHTTMAPESISSVWACLPRATTSGVHDAIDRVLKDSSTQKHLKDMARDLEQTLQAYYDPGCAIPEVWKMRCRILARVV
jgi:hypothetical protein